MRRWHDAAPVLAPHVPASSNSPTSCAGPARSPAPARHGRYIKWMQEHGVGGGKGDLHKVLEACTRELLKHERYANDIRFLRICIQYVRPQGLTAAALPRTRRPKAQPSVVIRPCSATMCVRTAPKTPPSPPVHPTPTHCAPCARAHTHQHAGMPPMPNDFVQADCLPDPADVFLFLKVRHTHMTGAAHCLMGCTWGVTRPVCGGGGRGAGRRLPKAGAVAPPCIRAGEGGR